ncbi:MAG TPA: hypothetical protein VEP49_22700 [Acidimicrobiia bacterium]|nr:hypothetical protein [Acidimicrobiia bacterium]
MHTTRALGHLALYYAPGDMDASRRLLEDLGCTLVENGPAPGKDGFCTVLVDGDSPTYADNILFLAPLTPTQQELERAIREEFSFGAGAPDGPATAFTDMKRHSPETASHFAIRYRDLEALEQVLAAVEADAAEGGPLHGRIELTKYRARPGLDPAVDARMATSPAFTGDESTAFANYWIQCFVKTDLFGYGILAFGQTIELDYVFEPFFAEPPKFGR